MSSFEILKSEHLKYVRKRTEHATYGYIRQFESSIDPTIAPLIYRICLAFYAESDRWDKTKMQTDMRIEFNEDTQTVKNTARIEDGNEWYGVFGELICKHPNIYHWKLRIDKLKFNKEIMIGVVYHDFKGTEDIAREHAFIFWSWDTGTCCYKDTVMVRTIKQNYGAILKDDDTVAIKLDLENYSLSFVINDQDYGVAIDNLPKGKMYRFGVSLGCKDNQVTLL